jgi:hypothetical protein
MSKDPVVYTADGYSVVINAKQLNETAAGLRSHEDDAYQAKAALLGSLVPQSAFGTIPGGPEAAARLKKAMGAHLDAIEKLGVSVLDLAARVAAAGKLAEDAEPDTVKVSRIPDVLQTPAG